jgi:secreted PhoX family phosphatase
MSLSRRSFLYTSLATLAFSGLRRYVEAQPIRTGISRTGYGPLKADPNRVVDLPEGFQYRVISRTGETMSDGLRVPGAHDGMAAFAGPRGTTILVRNHELSVDSFSESPFGEKNELLEVWNPENLYDAAPGLGGTTTLIYDTRRHVLEKHFLSLAGTIKNCAGGLTPWGSWISCEETTQPADDVHRKSHGFNFEVPARMQRMVEPSPLKAMGRFNHEAIAVDPATGIVYQTEDRGDGLIYRFLPQRRGQLAAGGRLQALKIGEMPGADTSNWSEQSIPVGQRFNVQWIDLHEVESPDDSLRKQGAYAGAARFSRGEGMWAGRGVIYFACTNGGHAKAGQIWRYIPSRFEGSSREGEKPGSLALFIEPNDRMQMENVDTITIAPWGDIIMCEDGPEANRVLGVTPGGVLYEFANNAMNTSEFAGATFSPDGTTLFVNIQNPGLTLAITGPWQTGS